MDIVTSMASDRVELISYVKEYLNDESLTWMRGLLAEINKRVVTQRSDEYTLRVYPLYKNMKRFFEEAADEVSAGGILFSMLLCGLEIGFTDILEGASLLKELTEEVDVDDLMTLNREMAFRYDFTMSNQLYEKYVMNTPKEESDGPIWACGMHSLMTMEFIEIGE